MIKNTAGQKVGAQVVSATDGSAFTGAVTVAVTGDAGTQATGSVGSGACTHEGNGYHTYAPAQAETNYDLIAFTFIGTGAIPATVQVYTVTGDAFARLGAPVGASISADLQTIDANVDAILVDTGTTLQGELDGIQADTEDIQARIPAALVGGRIDANVGALSSDSTAADNAEAFFDGTGYAGTNNIIPTVTTVNGLAANTITAASIAADAITAAKVAADVTTEIQSGLATAAALSTLQTSVDDLPTNAELATSQAAADDATLAAIAALNNLSSAQAQTAAAAALTAYDPPTNAEMEARTLTAALIAKLTAHLTGVLTVIVGSGSTTTSVVLNSSTGINGTTPSATNDFYNGRVLVFLTGTLAGQATDVTDYVGSTVTLTVTALTTGPSAGDTAVLV